MQVFLKIAIFITLFVDQTLLAQSAELTPDSVLALTPIIAQPKCSFFRIHESDLLSELNNLNLIENLDIDEFGDQSQVYFEYLNERNKLKFQRIAETKYLLVEVNLPATQYSIVSDYEAIAMQTYGVTDISNYDRFIFTPDNAIEREAGLLKFKIKVNLFDICINQKVTLILLKDCAKTAKMPVDCVANHMCEDLPVHQVDQCKTQSVFTISLKSTADSLGQRQGELRRTYP